ncbi:hypothetical protein BD560DRAFT_383249 [Blakeslea trispora]|nr:hypothetical protein BD560DRAFT_383249 [Blakeslea trispora]
MITTGIFLSLSLSFFLPHFLSSFPPCFFFCSFNRKRIARLHKHTKYNTQTKKHWFDQWSFVCYFPSSLISLSLFLFVLHFY